MTTLRPGFALTRRTRPTAVATILAVAIGLLLSPASAVLADTGKNTAEGGFTVSVSDVSELSGLKAEVSADGDGTDLRAEPTGSSAAVATLADGTVVNLRIDMTDTVYDGVGARWWPVEADGQEGWVAGTDLIAPGTGGDSGSADGMGFTFTGDTLEGASAVVSTDGDVLIIRAEPTASAEIVDRAPDGATIALRIDATDTVDEGGTRWWPVTWNGQEGWVSGLYLAAAASDGSTPYVPGVSSADAAGDGTSGSAREAFTFTGESLVGATAFAAGDGGDVTVRAEPSGDSAAVATVNDGATVALRIDVSDSVVEGDTRWWPVSVDGVDGWISGFFLTASGADDGSSSGALPVGATARVETDTGTGLRVRAAAGVDSAQVGSVAEDGQVTILAGPVSFDNSANGWYEISGEGVTGFADGDLLVPVATTVATPLPATEETVVIPGVSDGDAGFVPTVDATTEPSATTPAATAEVIATQTVTPEAQNPSATMTATATSAATTTDAATTATATTPATSTATATEEPEPEGPAFIIPVENSTLTQRFGCSSLGFYPYNPDWGCGVHDGVDWAAPTGTPILAAADGTVVTAGWCDCGLGYYVEIDHGNGLHTIYGHMASQPFVSVGQQVSQGETIGPLGSTGLSTGPHVHFMVQVNGISQDPANYLPPF